MKVDNAQDYYKPSNKSSIYEFDTKWRNFARTNGFFMQPKGYGDFFSHFLKGIDITYNVQITKVIQDKNKVTLYDQKGNIYKTDYVVVSVPIGVLKRNDIKFEPAISNGKQSLIKNTDIIMINKVMIEFTEKFWGDEFAITLLDKEFEDFYGINFHNINGKNLLIFIINDSVDFSLANYNVDQLQRYLVNKLKKCFPGKNVKAVKTIKTDWINEPFTYGAFTDYMQQQSSNIVQEWAKPEGRVYFVGEHTAERSGSTQGAWISGRERSKQIVGKIKSDFKIITP